MASLLLCSKQLPGLVCPPGQRKATYRDTGCKGLILEVRASGGRTWYVSCSPPGGKRRQLRLGDAQELPLARARALADRVRSQVLLSQYAPALSACSPRTATPTLQQFCEQQFLPHLQLHKPSWRGDEALLRLHILPLLGQLRLDQLQRQHVELVLKQQLDAGLKPNSANKAVVLLRTLINCAMAWDVVPLMHNPVGKGTLLKGSNQRQRLLSPEEAQRLLRAVDASRNPDLGDLVRLLLLTGVRKREALDARWSDIHWSQRQWLIPHRKASKPHAVVLTDPALHVLQHRHQRANPIIPWLFPSPKTGRPYRSVFCAWDKARRQAGLEELRMHDCRHSFASFVINAGRSLYEVQQLLGHSSSTMTERYAHLATTTLLEAATTAALALEAP